MTDQPTLEELRYENAELRIRNKLLRQSEAKAHQELATTYALLGEAHTRIAGLIEALETLKQGQEREAQ